MTITIVDHEVSFDDSGIQEFFNILNVFVCISLLTSVLSGVSTKQGFNTSNLKVLILCATARIAFKVLEESLLLIDNKLHGNECFKEPGQNTVGAWIGRNYFESDIVRGPDNPTKKAIFQQTLFSQLSQANSIAGCYGRNHCDTHADYTSHTIARNAAAVSVNKPHLTNTSIFRDNPFSYNDFHGDKNSNTGCSTDSTALHSKSVDERQRVNGTIPSPIRDNGIIKPTPKLHTHGIGNSHAETSNLKPSYAVLVGNSVRTYNTKLYASLPLQDKYMIKQRVQDASGATRIKLVLKSSNESSMKETVNSPSRIRMYDVDVETDGNNRKTHYRGNNKKAGYIVYTCDKSFRGDTKYPLPNGKATNSKIGKGGNGFVFIIYHGKKQYAVKQTVYRPNEVNVHSALNHVNVLPLLAVLMGEKHASHAGRFHCYHFMPKMDYDFRQILSTKEVGCLKYLYRNCSKNLAKFDRAFSNVKFILKETLKALSYIHSNGFVHRDVKASNIMIRMNCKCDPLYCDCPSKFKVKLGDFDSAGTIPGLGIKEPTDQMIKFASILPLGTRGYRAPEVSMHIVLSGPYETLYTTAVDMWSFGCLCLNICIGKTAALNQREEALLLLSNTNPCFEELWVKATKINELENTKPFANDIMLLQLIRLCLRVDYNKRLSSTDAQTYL